MARMGRPGMSDELRAELWVRWGRGESISEVARAVGKPPGSVFTILKGTGGYVPPVRTRRPGTLTATEREEIPTPDRWSLGTGAAVPPSVRYRPPVLELDPVEDELAPDGVPAPIRRV